MAEATIPQSKASRLSTRELRSIALYRERGEEIEHQGRGRFTVPGCSSGSYTVDLAIFSSAGEQSCTCPDTPPAGEVCKHIHAATIARAKRWAEARRRQVERNRERMMFSPDQVAANLERMGA